MKVYNTEKSAAYNAPKFLLLPPDTETEILPYESPKFHLLPVAEADILTASPLAEDEGTNTPILNEDGVWGN